MFRKNEVHLGKVLQEMLDKYRLRSNLDKLTIEKFWKEEMGQMVNRYTEKIYFHKGCLTIKVNSAALKNELYINRENLKQRINAYLNAQSIKSVKIL
ncbi:MAG: DUF721 domain-containing protein [Bacteroidia bacterium]|nr:DUF721 domain-containing protein [Bacteroidia bacterium]